MSDFDAIRKVLNRPTYSDQDEMEMLASAISNCALALEMLLEEVETLQAEVTMLKNDLQEVSNDCTRPLFGTSVQPGLW